MLLITAPSKTQSPIDRHLDSHTHPLFLHESKEIMSRLSPLSVEELCKLMKMSAALGESTKQRIDAFAPPLTPENSSQAIFTFQGDAYSSLAPADYSIDELQHAQEHIRILSGLYGVLRPLDLMFPYRLEMATRLAVGSHKNLYDFWREKVTGELHRELRDHSDPTLVNLASAEYAKVVDRKTFESRLLTITFKERQGDRSKTIPIHSKRARGMMLHFVISNRLTQASELREFSLGGYGYSEKLSTEKEWIFIRDRG